MAQPFVVSYKIVGDSSSGSAAAREVRQEVEALRRTVAMPTASGTQGGIDALLGIGQRGRPTQQAGADIAAFGDALDDLRAKYNPLFAAERQHRAILDDIRRAQRLGAISADEAAAAIRREETALLNATRAAQQHSAVLAGRGAGAPNTLLAGRGAGAANTANIAAQFQDIGVTAAMGMSPLQIALQQGTQLSAVLGGQGLRGTVTALAAAFASVLSPVSLLTIGVIGLGTFGVQALMGMMNGTEGATRSLEDHKKWLDKILVGYDAARQGAAAALEEAAKLPQGVVKSDLAASLKDQEVAARKLQERIEAARARIQETAEFLRQMQDIGTAGGGDPDSLAPFIAQVEYLAQLGISTASTRKELDAATVAARQLYHAAEDPALKEMADQVYQLAIELRTAAGTANATEDGLRRISNLSPINIAVRLRVEGADSALDQLRAGIPDLRSDVEKAKDDYDKALEETVKLPGSLSVTYRNAARQAYEERIEGLSEQERRRQAMLDQRGGAKTLDQWGNAKESFQQRIEATRNEAAALSLSTFAATRQKAAFDLLNQARQAGIPITTEVTRTINGLSAEYAREQEALNRLTAAQERNREQLEFNRNTFRGFFSDLRGELMNGASLWEGFGKAGVNAIGKIADRALGVAADGIFDLLLGAVAGSLGGAFGAGGAGASIGRGLKSLASGGYTGDMARNAIAGVVHGGEFVINAAATRQHRSLLEAVNDNRVPGYARGGFVGADRSAPNDTGGKEPWKVVIHNRTAAAQVEARPNHNRRELEVFVLDTVRDAGRRALPGFA